MRKRFLRFLALILAIVVSIGMCVGCGGALGGLGGIGGGSNGGGNQNASVTGTYKIDHMEYEGKYYKVGDVLYGDAITEDYVVVIVKPNGEAVVSSDYDAVIGSWREGSGNDKYEFYVNGRVFQATVSGTTMDLYETQTIKYTLRKTSSSTDSSWLENGSGTGGGNIDQGNGGGGNGSGSGGGTQGDRSKTQLFVNYYEQIGVNWLLEAKERFEAQYASTSFEDGKVGVQVVIKRDDTYFNPQLIATSSEDIFFVNGVNYISLVSMGCALDVTDVVTETISNEGASIEDKLHPDTKAHLTALNGNYYALPSQQIISGITYNKTLFDEKLLYFAANEEDYLSQQGTSPYYGFVKNATCNRTCGPDGEFGTYDDGLPSSLTELLRLCNMMKYLGITPFTCYGNNGLYPSHLITALWASLEGYDGAMANFKLSSSGKAVQLAVALGASGKVLETYDVAITEDNWRSLYTQKSRLDALKFAETIFSDESYFTLESFLKSISYSDHYSLFLGNYLAGENPVGMLIEFSTWENEARNTGVLSDMQSRYGEAFEQLEYRFMPLPILAEGSVKEGEGRTYTVVEPIETYAFIKGGIGKQRGEGVEFAAKKFLQFLYTDESLKRFTLSSGVTKNLHYMLSGEQASLSDFSKSVYNIVSNAQVVKPIATNPIVMQNYSEFNFTTGFWKMTNSSSGLGSPFNEFRNGTITAAEYFVRLEKPLNWLAQ